jgi:hypothetical protein
MKHTIVLMISTLSLFFLPLCAQNISVSIQITKGISCNGLSDGVLTAVALPAGSAYTFNWSNGATVAQLEGLPTGSYSVVIQNAAGASATASIVLPQPAALVLSPITALPLQVDSTGSVDVQTLGGTTPYTYTWVNQDGQLIANTEDLINAPAGIYTATAVDTNGCTAELSPVELIGVSNTREIKALNTLIFPNPAQQLIQVFWAPAELQGTHQFRLFDLQGRMVMQQEIFGAQGQASMDISQLPPGAYQGFIDTYFTGKIIKN